MNSGSARNELENLVKGNDNTERLTIDRVKEYAPNLRAENDEDLLTEFIRTNNADDVLFYCFYEYDLQRIAIEQTEKEKDERNKIKKQENLKGSELIRAILERMCGYPPQVDPIGLHQIQEKINPTLDNAEKSHLQLPDNPDALGTTIGRSLEDMFCDLFCFYLGLFRRKYINNSAIEKLSVRYKNGRRSTGDYIGFRTENTGQKCGYLTELMYIIKNDTTLKAYCQKSFKCDEIFTISQIAEIGMCVVYRNLFTHNPHGRWRTNKRNGDTNLSKMDGSTRENWENNWISIVNAMKAPQPNLPKHDMLKKMAVFYRQILNMLFEKHIYPQVIVMRSVNINEQEIHIVTADSSNPDDPTLFLTDCKFTPQTEFFCIARTNPISIDPILAPKSVSELFKWATKSNTEIEEENQGEA